MKKNIACSIAILLLYISTFSQVKVPGAVKTAFSNKFPGATGLKWEKENKSELEANFKMNNTDVSANFKLDGSWVETETTIPVADLPAAVKNAIDKKYPGANFIQVEKLEKPGGRLLYEAHIKVNGKNKELVLTRDGSFGE